MTHERGRPSDSEPSAPEGGEARVGDAMGTGAGGEKVPVQIRSNVCHARRAERKVRARRRERAFASIREGRRRELSL
jgi:hypothetical protein